MAKTKLKSVGVNTNFDKICTNSKTKTYSELEARNIGDTIAMRAFYWIRKEKPIRWSIQRATYEVLRGEKIADD